MNVLLKLFFSGITAAFLQLISNAYLYTNYDSESYTYFTQILLISLTLRPLITLKLENSLFRTQNFLPISLTIMLIASILSVFLILYAISQNNHRMLVVTGIVLVTAIYELSEILLIRLRKINTVSTVRLLRPLSLILFIYVSDILSFKFSISTVFLASYLPSLFIILSSCYIFSVKFSLLGFKEFYYFFKMESKLSIFVVPAGFLHGLTQLLIFNIVLELTSLELAALVGFAYRVLDGIINIIIPNLRLYLLEFTKLTELMLLRCLYFVVPITFVIVVLLSIFNGTDFSILIGMSLVISSRILITAFNIFAYQHRIDYLVLFDALICYLTVTGISCLNVAAPSLLYLGYLGTFPLCLCFYRIWIRRLKN